jgi:AraC-like DNA-binding protein
MSFTIAAVGASLALFLLALLRAKKVRGPADSRLSAWLILEAVFFLSIVATAADGPWSVWLLLLGQFALFAAIVTQYEYAAAAFGWRCNWAVHAVAAALVIALLAAPFLLASTVEPAGGGMVASGAPAWLLVVPFGGALIVAAYPLALLRKLHSAAPANRQEAAWVRVWAVTQLMAALLQLVTSAAAALSRIDPEHQIAALLAIQTLSVAYAGYRGILFPGVFSAARPAPRPARPVAKEEIEADVRALSDLCAAQKPYTSAELTAQELASMLGWGQDRLTRALRHQGTNFFEFVNACRVKVVQSLALQRRERKEDLLGLAHDAGFGSKTAFYEAFKRHTGMSPAAWRRQLADGGDG